MDLTAGHSAQIIASAEAAGATLQQTAYMLATTRWETNGTMQPVREAYWLSEAWRKANLRYWPWYGRGFAQLTWERNYALAEEKTGAKLTPARNADKAMDPEVAADVLVIGSLEGWFTGKKLGDYINADGCDYVGARRVINGTDKAKAIAEIALDYEFALSPSPDYPAIRRGSRGPAVVALQTALVPMGYAIGEIDGIFGQKTDTAVRRFQAKRGLTVDGIAGPKTWAEVNTRRATA